MKGETCLYALLSHVPTNKNATPILLPQFNRQIDTNCN